jgi:flagellar basal body rod protein FlgG
MNGLYVAASGAASQMSTLVAAASNVANAATPGYRRFISVIQSVESGGSPYEMASAGDAPPIDMSQGPIDPTGNPLDIAITGAPFIAVNTPDGTRYTRNGQLQLSGEGVLMAAGFPIANSGGGEIKLKSGKIAIGGDGSISVGDKPTARLMLADPTGVTMTPAGGSLYRSAGDQELPPIAHAAGMVHQGFIEMPAGTETTALIAMMDVMRSYEAAMKSMQSIDQNQDRTAQAFTLSA